MAQAAVSNITNSTRRNFMQRALLLMGGATAAPVLVNALPALPNDPKALAAHYAGKLAETLNAINPGSYRIEFVEAAGVVMIINDTFKAGA